MKNIAVSFFIVLLACPAAFSQLVPAVILPPGIFLRDSASLLLHQFSVVEKDTKALLRWKIDSLPAAESFFAIERSYDGINFSLVGVTRTTTSGWSEFLDESPPKGKIFYRVKLSNDQISYYSEVISATPAADVSFKFYPNPVDKVLIIKSELSVEVQISDRFGKAILVDKCPGGLKVLDVSALEPGIYVITLFQKESGHLVTEKLVKK